MSQLAIKGHPTRGKEVIQLLEMLGGKNSNNLKAISKSYFYYIKDAIINNICYLEMVFTTEDFKIYTLEEFEEKFPYKVGDIVKCHNIWKGIIESMEWYEGEVLYHVRDYSNDYLASETVEYLDNIAREKLDKTMEEIEIALALFKVGDKVIVKGYEKMGEDEVICVFKTYDGDIKYKTKNHLNTHYFMEDSFTKIEKSNKGENMEEPEPKAPILSNRYDYAEGKCGYVIPDGYEFDCIKEGFQTEIILKPKKPTYPKTYKECCEVLGYSGNYNMILTTDIDCKLFNAFYRLKVCRDAYWKLAGKEMGLDKPWEPKHEYDKEIFFIYCDRVNGINKGQGFPTDNFCLCFPTKEMRDAFFENFEDLINDCKELL